MTERDAPMTGDCSGATCTHVTAPGADSISPVAEALPPVGIVCPQCGATNPVGATVCKVNPTCGSFLPKNDAALVHGGHARMLLEQPDVQAAMRSERETVARELGGDAATIKANVISAYVQARTIRESMFEQMTRTGIKGQAFARYVAILDREMRLAALLGLERRSRPINPLDAVRAAVEAANRA